MKIPLLTLTLLIASQSLAQNTALPDGFKKIDRNGDGKVTREEMPKLFDQIDADKDCVATVAELTAYFAKARPKGGGGTPAPATGPA